MTAHRYNREKTPNLFTSALENNEEEDFDELIKLIMGQPTNHDPTSVSAPMPEGEFRLTRKAY